MNGTTTTTKNDVLSPYSLRNSHLVCSTLLRDGLDITDDERVCVEELAPNIVQDLSDLALDYNKIKLGKKIGEGGFGDVYKVCVW